MSPIHNNYLAWSHYNVAFPLFLSPPLIIIGLLPLLFTFQYFWQVYEQLGSFEQKNTTDLFMRVECHLDPAYFVQWKSFLIVAEVVHNWLNFDIPKLLFFVCRSSRLSSLATITPNQFKATTNGAWLCEPVGISENQAHLFQAVNPVYCYLTRCTLPC